MQARGTRAVPILKSCGLRTQSTTHQGPHQGPPGSRIQRRGSEVTGAVKCQVPHQKLAPENTPGPSRCTEPAHGHTWHQTQALPATDLVLREAACSCGQQLSEPYHTPAACSPSSPHRGRTWPRHPTGGHPEAPVHPQTGHTAPLYRATLASWPASCLGPTNSPQLFPITRTRDVVTHHRLGRLRSLPPLRSPGVSRLYPSLGFPPKLAGGSPLSMLGHKKLTMSPNMPILS